MLAGACIGAWGGRPVGGGFLSIFEPELGGSLAPRASGLLGEGGFLTDEAAVFVVGGFVFFSVVAVFLYSERAVDDRDWGCVTCAGLCDLC